MYTEYVKELMLILENTKVYSKEQACEYDYEEGLKIMFEMFSQTKAAGSSFFLSVMEEVQQ